MKRRRSSSHDLEGESRQTHLAKALDEVSAELAERITKGNEIKQALSPATFITGDVDKAAAQIRSWNDYNRTYLERAFTTSQIADEYAGVGVPLIAWGGPETPRERLQKLLGDLQWNIDFLTGLQDRLSLYVPPSKPVTSPPAAVSTGVVRTALATTPPGDIPPQEQKLDALQKVMDTQQPPVATPEDWAGTHRVFLQVIFECFSASGDWPEIPTLQRDLDRLDEKALVPVDIDVGETARTMPKELGIRDYNPPRIWLKVRALATLPAAQPLLDSFMRVIWLASQRYLAPDGGPKLDEAT